MTVTHATLHNEDELRRKDVRIGDTVIVRRAGDVIPEVVGVIKEKRPKRTRLWHIPDKCPECGSKVIREEGEVAHHCTAGLYCPAQRTGQFCISRAVAPWMSRVWATSWWSSWSKRK